MVAVGDAGRRSSLLVELAGRGERKDVEGRPFFGYEGGFGWERNSSGRRRDEGWEQLRCWEGRGRGRGVQLGGREGGREGAQPPPPESLPRRSTNMKPTGFSTGRVHPYHVRGQSTVSKEVGIEGKRKGTRTHLELSFAMEVDLDSSKRSEQSTPLQID